MNFLSRFTRIEMLSGTLYDKILFFTLPLALTGILQQCFNAADVMVLGHFVGDSAMAAVGNNVPIIGLLVSLFMGASIGANVVVARYLGMEDNEVVTDAVQTSFLVSVILGVILALLGLIFSGVTIDALEVPESVREESLLYLQIYLVGLPFMSIYNFEAALLRAKGDTATPLVALFYAGVLNLVGNLAATWVFHYGIGAVALATTLSNILSAYLLFHKMIKAQDEISLKFKTLHKFNMRKCRAIFKIGLPAGIQGMVFCLSNLVIQNAINSLGADVMAASAAAFILEINVYAFVNAFGLATTTFVGQNFGAGNLKRCKRATFVTMGLGVLVSLVITGIIVIFMTPLLALFSASEIVISFGIIRVLYVLMPQPMNIVLEVLSGAMRGYGFSLPPAIITLFSICGVRLVYVFTVFEEHPAFDTLMLVYPLSWIVCIVFLLITYVLHQRHLNRTLKQDSEPKTLE